MTWFFVLFSRSCCLKNKKKKKKGKKQPHPNPKPTTKHSKPAKQKKTPQPPHPPITTRKYSFLWRKFLWQWVRISVFFFFTLIIQWKIFQEAPHSPIFTPSAMSSCGESRGPCTLKWGSVAGKTWCVFSSMGEMQMLCIWPPFHRAGLDLCSLYWWEYPFQVEVRSKLSEPVCFLLKVLSESHCQ